MWCQHGLLLTSRRRRRLQCSRHRVLWIKLEEAVGDKRRARKEAKALDEGVRFLEMSVWLKNCWHGMCGCESWVPRRSFPFSFSWPSLRWSIVCCSVYRIWVTFSTFHAIQVCSPERFAMVLGEIDQNWVLWPRCFLKSFKPWSPTGSPYPSHTFSIFRTCESFCFSNP